MPEHATPEPAAWSGTPVLASVIADLGERRRLAVADAARMRRRLADVEAMHEPDADGECPACRTPAPCATLQLARGQIDYEAACAAVRGLIDLTLFESAAAPAPRIPRLADLLATPTHGVDRFFDVLLGDQRD